LQKYEKLYWPRSVNLIAQFLAKCLSGEKLNPMNRL